MNLPSWLLKNPLAVAFGAGLALLVGLATFGKRGRSVKEATEFLTVQRPIAYVYDAEPMNHREWILFAGDEPELFQFSKPGESSLSVVRAIQARGNYAAVNFDKSSREFYVLDEFTPLQVARMKQQYGQGWADSNLLPGGV